MITQGKWTLEGATVVVNDKGSRTVICNTFNDETPIAEYLANARLIASAPILLDAAKKALAALGSPEARKAISFTPERELLAEAIKQAGEPVGDSEGMIDGFTVENIQDLLDTAFEGGSNYWYIITGYEYPQGENKVSLGLKYQYLELPFMGGTVLIGDKEDSRVEKRLDLEAIRRGLATMESLYPMQYADFKTDNADASTGDVFLQCCLFGVAIYG